MTFFYTISIVFSVINRKKLFYFSIFGLVVPFSLIIYYSLSLRHNIKYTFFNEI